MLVSENSRFLTMITGFFMVIIVIIIIVTVGNDWSAAVKPWQQLWFSIIRMVLQQFHYVIKSDTVKTIIVL